MKKNKDGPTADYADVNKTRTFIMHKICFHRRNNEAESRIRSSNSTERQKRAIANKALSFSLAFFVTYIFPIIMRSIRALSGHESDNALSILARIFFPLQGFFNFAVFIFPKVLVAKKSGGNITWFGAFAIAVLSRGRPLSNRNLNLSSDKRQQSSILLSQNQ